MNDERKRILDSIEEQLMYEPTRRTRNKKILVGLVPPWEHIEPVWQLRVGKYRVFYDVVEETSTVFVRAVRHKPPHIKLQRKFYDYNRSGRGISGYLYQCRSA